MFICWSEEGEELDISIKWMIVVEGIVGSQANSVDYEDSKGNWVQYPPIELVAEAGKGDDGAGIKAMDMTNETSPLS